MNTAPSTLDDQTASAIRSALGFAQGGRLSEACRAAEQGLADGGAPGPLHALLGMLRCRAGDLAGGIASLRQAQAERPHDPSIALNLATALIDSGQSNQALAVTTADLAAAEPSGRLGRLRAWLLQDGHAWTEAAEAYQLHLARHPADWEGWNNLGNALSALGRAEEALAALRRAVELASAVPPLRMNLARTLSELGQNKEAEAVLRQAADDFPDDEHPLLDLHALLRGRGDSEGALLAARAAASRRPDDPAVQTLLGRAEMESLDVPAAERAFRAALAADPLFADAFVGLAVAYEHDRPEALEPLAAEARDAGVAEPQRRLIEAFAAQRNGDYQEVVRLLGSAPEEVEPVHRNSLLGQAYDRLGDSPRAFAAFTAMNEAVAADPTDPVAAGERHRAEIARQAEELDKAWLRQWTSPDLPAPERTPVFLLGFPRSGTTLLDTLLMGHPGVEVMEEKRALWEVDRLVGGFDALPRLSADDIAAARHRYFEEARKHVPLAPGKLLVDKSPLFLNRLPLIMRLFPDARIILALRHPADVLLSCFVSNFRPNPAMASFLRLDTAADFYDTTFSYWNKARDLFQPAVAEVRYERLVDNPEAELRPLVEWLGLDWQPELLDHRRTAKARGLITTASYAQVHQPIYTRSRGRWERYKTELAPVLPLLRRWIDAFGYPAA